MSFKDHICFQERKLGFCLWLPEVNLIDGLNDERQMYPLALQPAWP